MLRDSGDVVRIADATRILGFTRTQAAKLLSRWAGQGWLRRVGHGERAGTKREWGKTRLTPHRPKPSLQYVIAEIDTDDGNHRRRRGVHGHRLLRRAGGGGCRAPSTSKPGPISIADNPCSSRRSPRPPSRFACPRRTLRALDPHSAKWTPRHSMSQCTTSSSAGTFCTSSITMKPAPCRRCFSNRSSGACR